MAKAAIRLTAAFCPNKIRDRQPQALSAAARDAEIDVGGVSARDPEQWDYYTCPGACGQFRYRQRTRKLQPV